MLATLLAAGAIAAAPQLTAHVTLEDAGGAETSFDCAWTTVPDDADCRSIVGDAQDEIALLERHGAVRAWIAVDAGRYGTIARTVQRRSDGTWLHRGTAGGRAWGFVCAGEPLRCAHWQETEERSASAAIKRATKRVKR